MAAMNGEQTDLLSIGEFARRSNLSISALRFYGECGLLMPASTDSNTGYRYYSEDQVREAELVRTLRALDMPISEIQSLLTADTHVAEGLLDQHWRRLGERLERARKAVGEAKALLRSKEMTMPATATLEGSQLAAGLRLVVPAAGALHRTEGFPAAVLIEVREDGLRLAATDGHRLAVRDLPAHTTESGRTVIAASDADELATRAESRDRVTVGCGNRLTVSSDEKTEHIAAASDHYPDYEAVLARCGRSKLLVKTRDILDRLDQSREVVVLDLGTHGVKLDGSTVDGRYEGDDLIIGFDPSYLAEGLSVGIGPEALLQLGGPFDPVALRSADDGSLTWLVMPMRLKERAAS